MPSARVRERNPTLVRECPTWLANIVGSPGLPATLSASQNSPCVTIPADPVRELFASSAASEREAAMFHPGAIIVISLRDPREKFFGALLSLGVAGVAFRGIPLESFDDFALQLRDGEAATPMTAFFPMHRIDRIELDAPSAGVPSLAERFASKSRHTASLVFWPEGA